jgi:hypothetical protein
VSAKLTPEICINKVSSKSRLTTGGRQATATDRHSQNCLQTLFFSLSTFDEKTTELHLHAEKLTETVLHLNFGHCWLFFLFFYALCGFVLFYFSPLMRQLQNNNWGTISRIGGWGTNTKIAFELRDIFYFLLYFFIVIYIIYLFIFLIFFYFLFSILSLSL